MAGRGFGVVPGGALLFSTSAREGGTDAKRPGCPRAPGSKQAGPQVGTHRPFWGQPARLVWWVTREEPSVIEPGTVRTAPDLTPKCGRGYVRPVAFWETGRAQTVQAPAMQLGNERVAGARPILENSTACQKSMPSFTSSRRVLSSIVVVGGGVWCTIFILWLMTDRQRRFCFCWLFVLSRGLNPLWGVVVFPAFGWGMKYINGEFDPGSGRTLAACLTHASRTVIHGACIVVISGERVSNT